MAGGKKYPKYSVLMTVYAKEKAEYLKEAIDSMLNQTIKPSEFVLVEDGPLNDGLYIVIKQYKKNPIFKVVTLKENQGSGPASAVGVEACTYEWIARLDSDDWSVPSRIEKQFDAFLTNEELDIIGSNCNEFIGGRNNIVSRVVLPETNEELVKFAKRRCPLRNSAILVKKEAVLKAGNYRKFDLFEDYDLYVRMIQKGAKQYNVQEPLVFVRTSRDFYKRRGGIKYAKRIMKFKNEQRRTKYYTFKEWIISTIPHVGVALVPNFARKYIYKKMLRKDIRTPKIDDNKNRSITVLHVTDLSTINSNGVAVAVKQYLKYEKNKANVAVYNCNKDVKCGGVKVFNRKNYRKISDLPGIYSHPDLVIFNEVYKPRYIRMYKWCRKNNIKYIVIPHGCLTRGDQEKKKLKKKVGNALLFNNFLKNASAIQFLSDGEKNNTDFRPKNSIVRGNGVEKCGENSPSTVNVVYIGRYDINHKGLDIILDTCQAYGEWFRNNNVSLELYGKETGSDKHKMIETVNKYLISDFVHINGPIYNLEKEKVLSGAYCFIHSSRYEGQPMAILEALSYGVPCMVSQGTNMAKYIDNNKCGIVANNKEEIFKSIKILHDDNNLRYKMSLNARSCCIRDYAWPIVAARTIDDYKKILETYNG